ncbi:poly-beta-1,6 N-acetyl-D-glucosamine export porin PgaA [Paraburkholderia tagetis]|uniref:Poly-beta-1,6 N-acetyl-D-glucosamine export porin PgaA n=1 Tax=Paraburkholderia tagetis TaxID=2913261 RepID=A0A9X1UH18_9BURK|nr:poly-beta-1,6 N-acetyl-D-glucosamine export porin PgaA [Paraburkholderia tagetis]MCG5076164.1 poly-beta-1,6 N-acetyl-D-glucosamine export porin PgaA [Paraburkholderia tagetis]
MLLSAYAVLESKNGFAQEANTAKPVVFMVALADNTSSDPVAHPVMTDAGGSTVYAVLASADVPQSTVSDVAGVAVTEPSGRAAAAPVATLAQAPSSPAPEPVVSPKTEPTIAPAAAPPPTSASSPAQQAQGSGPTQPAPGTAPVTPEMQLPTTGNGPQAGEDLRHQIFGLATSGGANRALEEAKKRPDMFSAVDLAEIEELAIRQEVRGGRSKVRAMSSVDRFDALDGAIRHAEEFDKRLPNTPEYAQVRTSLAGDRTVAYAARGRMEDAVAVFETIPPNAEVSAEALASVGDAYSYLQQPAKSEVVYRRAVQQTLAKPSDAATLGYQYGSHTRLIDLREGLFYALTDQNKYAQAHQVLEDIRGSLPPTKNLAPTDPANDDYLRYYRLFAQYQIFIGQTNEGMAGLQRLEEQVPFSAEVRDAQADATLGLGHTRSARDMYVATLTDHPDNVEAMAGLGRASLALEDYANAHRINTAFDNTFPENGSVRNFQRDYKAYRAPVLTVEVNGEHGASKLADTQFSIDTTLYSPPIFDNWRVFAHTFYGHAVTDIGTVNRTRTGVGGDYRSGSLNVTGEVTRSMGGDGRTGGNGEVSYAFNDYLSASVGVDSDSNSLPMKAYLNHIWGKTAQASINFNDGDRRSASLSYTAARYSDSNFNQEIALSGTQRVFTAANQLVNVSLNLGTSSNTINNAAYYAPARDYAAEVVAMHQWAIWRSGEKSLVQRVYLTAGAYNERGFGTSPELGARIEHNWTFSHDVTLRYGFGVLSHAYDGSREFSELAYATLTVPF